MVGNGELFFEPGDRISMKHSLRRTLVLNNIIEQCEVSKHRASLRGRQSNLLAKQLLTHDKRLLRTSQ